MEIQKLRALIVLAETASYTETAERLYTTQSNISKQIQSVEKELGVQLFERSKRNISPTESGHAAIGHAKVILQEYDAMCQDLAAEGNELQIACLPVMAHYGLTGLISTFQKKYPHIPLSLEEIEDQDILEKIRQGQVELAICRKDSIRRNRRYETLTLHRDRLVAVLPEKHPLSNQKSVSLKQLQGEHFLQLGKTSTLYDTVVKACSREGFQPDIRYTSRRMENLLAMVGEGDGISLMMEHAVRYLPASGVCILPLEEEIISELALVRLREKQKSAGAKSFWTFSQSWVRAFVLRRS